jgi:hypothetical protein
VLTAYFLSHCFANNGKYNEIKVELVAPDGGPLTVLDQKRESRGPQKESGEGLTVAGKDGGSWVP